ncbi:MAG: hypothetical protein II921_02770 [Treponema sp.]|nr:hypothetical protein [Treponema sp.]
MKFPSFTSARKVFFVLSFAAILAACDTGSGGGGGGSSSSSSSSSSQSSSGTTTATKSKTATFDASNPSIEIDSSIKTLTINGLSGQAGKAVYLAKVNNTSSDISSSNVRYVTSYTGITAPSYLSLDASPSRVAQTLSENDSSGCLLLGVDENATYDSSARSVSADATNYAVGDTKSITNPINTSSTMTIKLLKKTDHAYIWGSTSDGYTESNFTAADTFASKFEDIYLLDRTAFGEESDLMFNSSSATNPVSMSSISDTGTMINIVFFKMDDGYNGAFSTNDYYYNSTSNKGKYIYINSKAAMERQSQIILTMAHEFVHMIQANYKIINPVANGKSALSAPTAYGEMLAELAKDLVSNYFEIGDTDNANLRFKTFNLLYCTVGMTGIDSANYYYSTNFAFGAWLCRHYGGAKLAQTIIQNDSTGDDSIVSAVNSLNGTSYTMNQLIAQFVQAITMPNSSYTLKKSATSTISCTGLSSGTSYNYPQSAIDIFDISSVYGSEASSLTGTKKASLYGPLLFQANTQLSSSLYSPYSGLKSSHGVTLHKIGTVTSGASSATITFSDSGSSNLTMYVMVGDDRNIYTTK